MSREIAGFSIALLFGACLLTGLTAQNANTRSGNWYRRLPTSSQHNDVWGLRTGTGREYAIYGEKDGFSILELPSLTSLRVVGFFKAPGGSSTTTRRDFTSVGRFFYAVSMHHAGIRVVEVLQNGSAKDHGFVHTKTITSARSIQSDPDTGYLYIFGGNNVGMVVFETGTSPANPKLLSKWNKTFVSDACVYRGRAYACTGTGFETRLLDIRDPAKVSQIGACKTKGGYNSAAWVSEDQRILAITDELPRSLVTPHLTLWDVSNPAIPVKRGDYDPGKGAISHKVFVKQRGAYVAYFTRGMHFVDITDPARPTKVACFDPSSAPGGFHGVFGCYPFQDSGIVYVSDVERGFFSVQINCGHLNRYGLGTPGRAGRVPRAEFDGALPRVGATGLRLKIRDLEPSARFWLVVGSGRGPGFFFLSARVEIDVSKTAIILGPFTADAAGEANLASPVPNLPTLAIARPHFQIFSVRQNGQFSASRGMWSGICR